MRFYLASGMNCLGGIVDLLVVLINNEKLFYLVWELARTAASRTGASFAASFRFLLFAAPTAAIATFARTWCKKVFANGEVLDREA